MSLTELDSLASVTDVDLVHEPATGSRRERRLAVDATGPRRSPAPDARGHASPEIATGTSTTPPEGDADLSKPRRAAMTPARGTVVWVLATISLLALWYVVYAIVLTPFEEARQQTVLYNKMRQSLAAETAPLGGRIAPGTPVALLSSPRLGIVDDVVVEGTASGDLMAGPGHKRDTALPGQAGASVLYGRANLFGGPFGSIGRARPGDTIIATTGQGVFTYTVEDVRRAGDLYPPALTQGAGRLTLVSAATVGRFATPDGAVYVDARLVGQAQPSPGGGPAVVPKAEQAMQGDQSALLMLALALPLLIGALVLIVWARARWGGWQTWLIGAPLVLATLWAASQAAIQLLPNLL